MAAAGVLTNSLVAEVGALLDLTITDNTTPSKTDTIRWMNRAAIKLFKVLPVEHLVDVQKVELISGYIASGSDFNPSLLRVVDVIVNGAAADKIDNVALKRLPTESPYKYSLAQPAYSVKGSSGSMSIEAYPTTASLLHVTYIPTPTKYSTVTEDDTYSPPESLEEFIVQYASIMAREQDEEPGQFQLYMKQWMEDIQMAYSIPAQNSEG